MIDGARDDPFFEQPAAALRALRAELPAAEHRPRCGHGPPAYDASSAVTGCRMIVFIFSGARRGSLR